jgi:hypothetical protein
MDFLKSVRQAPYLAGMAGLILLLSSWTMGFSRTCTVDGCLGMLYLLGGALLLLVVQIFVCVPVFAVLARRAGRPSFAVTWVLISVACFGVPLLFAGKHGL